MLTKIVNGEAVECSPQEEAAIRAEWATNANRPPPKAAVTVEGLAALLVGKGILSAEDLSAALVAMPTPAALPE